MNKMKTEDKCAFCDKPAQWVRATQFAGNHFFCDEHAKKESDFGKDGGSYFFWMVVK
jgi:hypothetical protein